MIFEDTVFCPCDSKILYVENSVNDNPIGHSNSENPAGNHIWLQKGVYYILIAHLQKGSISVKVGDSVKTGQMLGKVGNSGNTSEPHLHIHAVRKLNVREIPQRWHFLGVPTPIWFNNQFLVRDDRFIWK
jgi:murein DD-endopeptidase MepM/ murein hydrolase activator NlpD